MLMADTYKNTNPDALPKGLTKLTSYITPRKSMFKNLNEVVFFGLQGFIKEYMIDLVNETFFKRPKKKLLQNIKNIWIIRSVLRVMILDVSKNYGICSIYL